MQTVLVPVWLGVLIIFIDSLDDVEVINKLATNLALSSAALASGSFFGVLFGIPRSSWSKNNNSGSTNNTSSLGNQIAQNNLDYMDNTNIEEISDWLTKILVGIGLVQLTKIITYILRFQEQLKQPNNKVFEISLVILFIVWGFFLGYLSARLFLPTAFGRALHRQLEATNEALKASDEFANQFCGEQENEFRTYLAAYYNKKLDNDDINLLNKLSDDKSDNVINQDFSRGSPYHNQLRKLRRLWLIYPVQGTQWEIGKKIQLTIFAKSYLKERSESPLASGDEH